MSLLYIIAMVILVTMSIRNLLLYKSFKKERNFVDMYTKFLKDDSNIYQDCKEYLQNETTDYLITKGNIFLAFLNLVNGDDASDAINGMSFSPLFLDKNGKYDKNGAARNNDVFIWLAMLFAKAKTAGKEEVIDKVYNKALTLEETLGQSVEYKVFKGVTAALKGDKNEDYDFLKKLLDGEYEGLVYDKRLIGLYKRIAATFLIYAKEEVDEYSKQDVHEFAKTAIGKKIINGLELDGQFAYVETNAPIEIETKEEDK